MPKQSRGFWICDFCDTTFDSFEDANSHENLVCRRRHHHQRHYQGTQLQQQQQPYQQQLSSYPQTHPMPPFSSESRSTQSAPFAGYDSKAPPPTPPRQPWRRPLLEPNESSYLTESDNVACQSLELFEFTDDTFPATKSQLGLRCCYCQANYVTPESVATVGEYVRRMADQHLAAAACSAAPQSVCEILVRAAQQRSQFRAEAGPSWHEEESEHRVLVDFCVQRCQQLGVVNKLPSGIVLAGSSQTGYEYSMAASPNVSSTTGGGALAVDTKPAATPVREAASSMVGQVATYRSDPSAPSFAASGVASYEPPPETGSGVAMAGDNSFEPVPLEQTTATISHGHSPQHTMQLSFPGGDFPFFQAANGDWICRYCCNTRPEYRDANYIWSTPSKAPPTNSFVDYHLSMCRDYQSRMNYAYYQPSYSNYIESQHPAAVYASQQQSWEEARDYGTVGRASYPNYSSASPTRPPQPEMDRFANSHPQDAASYVSPQMVARGGESSSEIATRRSIEHLAASDRSDFDIHGVPLPDEKKLVLDEDKVLLTDYFFYVIKQLRLVRFSEADRRTRGGKREKVQVGYGGLQCFHCANTPNARKFFWSNVDRLANSFAEIPAHILKCRRCPPTTKEALLQLKQQHPEQMARLPRGSQKVFFRRMWRRLHDDDPQTTPVESPGSKVEASSSAEQLASGAASLEPIDTKPSPQQQESPDRTAGSDESILLLERSATEAAKALTDAAMQTGPPSPSSRVLLAIPEDKEWLSDIDCFVRRQIELFCATKDDVKAAEVDGSYSVREGQVGIRCVHCALMNVARMNAVAYPANISGMYECVREFQRLHLEECTNVPPAVKSKLTSIKGATSLSSVLRKYYILSARAMGLQDTPEQGVRAGGKSVPFGSQSAFLFPEGKSTLSEEMKMSPPGRSGDPRGVSDSSPKKRKALDEFIDIPGPKKTPGPS